MKLAIIDGQGAGLVLGIIKKLKKEICSDIYITALGTNPAATTAMIKAGADCGFTGQSEICAFLKSSPIDALIGPIGILCSGGINGEITSRISQTIFEIHCTKYIIPLKKHGIYIPGTRNLDIKEITSEIIKDIKRQFLIST